LKNIIAPLKVKKTKKGIKKKSVKTEGLKSSAC